MNVGICGDAAVVTCSARGGIMLTQPRRTGLLTVKLPHPIAALAVFVVVLLLYVAALITYTPLLNSVHADHSWRIGASRTGLVAAVLVGIWLVVLWRRYMRAWGASRPGGIDIAVAPASPNEAGANQIAAELRNALTDVYLTGPSVVPGASAPQDFLTEVRGVAKQAHTSWGVVIGAMSLVSPRNVYRVLCTEHANESGGTHGLTIEISGLPREEASVATVWGDTWPQVARQAACHIAAYVLPRAKLSLRPPWTPWHGIKISGELFYSFDEARRLARTGRLEESLHHFDDAIRRDPLNPYIRVERAAAYDQLGLWIDALASYVDAVTMESWFDRRSWERYRRIILDERRGAPSWFTRSPNGTAALLVARYRTVCSLATADRLARQWAKNSSRQAIQPKRRAETELVIDRLRPLVVSYARLMMDAHRMHASAQQVVIQNIRNNEPNTLRRVFQFAALTEAAAIRDDYLRWGHRRHPWKPLAITKEAMRALPLWAALQYHYVEHVQALASQMTNINNRIGPWTTRNSKRLRSRRKYDMRWLEEIDEKVGLQAKNARLLDWPPRPDGISDWLEKQLSFSKKVAAKFGWGGVVHGWQAHYNTACTFAVGMITEELRTVRRMNNKSELRNNRLVQSAINELTRAVVATDSQFAAGRSVWLRRGDQNFDDLRSTHRYRAFVERYLPDAQPAFRPDAHPAFRLPLNPTPLLVSDHITRMVAVYAKFRGAFWQQQVEWNAIDVNEFSTEPEWWNSLSDICANYWDWRTRWEIINRVTALDKRLGKLNSNVFALAPPVATLGHEEIAMQNKTETFERCEIGGGVNKLPPHGGRPIEEWLSNLRRQPRYIKNLANNVIEMPIARLDLLGGWLNDWQLQSLTEETIRGRLGDIAARQISDLGGKQLATHLAEAWKSIGNWLECGSPIDKCTLCFVRLAQTTRSNLMRIDSL